MSTDAFLALLVYALVTSITPGPNNFMLLASGVNFGFARTIPHMLGIGIGFLVLLLAVGFGLGAVLTAFPALHTGLKIAGGAYLLYLAWKIAMSRSIGANADSTKARPMSFLEAAAFQWVNPKAWVMAVGAISTYLPNASHLPDVAALALIYGVLGAPCIGVWAGFGVAMRRVLTDARSVRIFNGFAAALLVASLYPILFE